MAIITDYTTLQSEIADWLHRSDLTDKITSFISLAENKLNGDLTSRQMETQTTLTTAGGTAYYSLPDDIIDFRRVLLQTSPTLVLKYVTPDEISTDYSTSTTGQPVVFTVIANQIQLAPIPDSTYSIQLTYRQRLTALSATNTTNWLLRLYPNVYLYGSLLQAAPYIIGDARIPTLAQLYQDAVDNVNNIDWYTGSTMRVRAT